MINEENKSLLDGFISTKRLGKHAYVRRADLEAWLEAA
jgi:hypothetical protein